MRYWYQGQPARGLQSVNNSGTMRYWYQGQVDGWLPGTGSTSLALEAKGLSAGGGRAMLSSMSIALAAQGKGKTWGACGPRGMIVLLAKGFARSSGRGKGLSLLALKAQGVGKTSGRMGSAVLSPLTFFARSSSRSSGKVVSKPFGTYVVAFTAYFWRRL